MIGKRQFLAGLGVMMASDKDGPGVGWIFRIEMI
jgi:hypothetical protein